MELEGSVYSQSHPNSQAQVWIQSVSFNTRLLQPAIVNGIFLWKSEFSVERLKESEKFFRGKFTDLLFWLFFGFYFF